MCCSGQGGRVSSRVHIKELHRKEEQLMAKGSVNHCWGDEFGSFHDVLFPAVGTDFECSLVKH